MLNLLSYQYNLGKAYVIAMFCSFSGHKNPPLIESSQDNSGKPRSVYLCRRCLKTIGEKPYGERKPIRSRFR